MTSVTSRWFSTIRLISGFDKTTGCWIWDFESKHDSPSSIFSFLRAARSVCVRFTHGGALSVPIFSPPQMIYWHYSNLIFCPSTLDTNKSPWCWWLSLHAADFLLSRRVYLNISSGPRIYIRVYGLLLIITRAALSRLVSLPHKSAPIFHFYIARTTTFMLV